MVNGILGGLKTKSMLKVRDRISGFLPIQGSSSEWKSAGHPKSFLVPLKNSHLWSFKRLYEIRGGPGNLHIIIHGHSQKLSIPHPTLYKQSAERIQSSVQSAESETEIFSAVQDRHFWGEKRTTESGGKTFWAVRQKREILRNNFVNGAGPIRTKRWK